MLVGELIEGKGVMVSRETPVLDVLERLLEMEHDAAAVIGENGEFFGVIGIRDVLRAIVPTHIYLDSNLVNVVHEGYFQERFERVKDTPTERLMDHDIQTLSSDATVFKAVAMIVENRRKTIPVIDDGQFLGMVTRKSLLRKVLRRKTARYETPVENLISEEEAK